jgi:hypothetical protein
VSQLLLLPNNCPVLKILGFYPQPSFQGQPVTSPQLEVVREGIPPTESWDGPPPLPPKTGPLARFRWQKQLLKTPRMLLSVVRTSGWVFKVCWVDFTLLHIVKIPTFYLRRYGQNCPYCRKIEEIYKKKNSCCPITSLLRR